MGSWADGSEITGPSAPAFGLAGEGESSTTTTSWEGSWVGSWAAPGDTTPCEASPSDASESGAATATATAALPTVGVTFGVTVGVTSDASEIRIATGCFALFEPGSD